MSLHTHKAHFRPGAKEYGTFILAGLIVAGWAVVTVQSEGPTWEITQGTVQSGNHVEAASTALSKAQLVHVEYVYTALGQTYRDSWEGDWPRSNTPNALYAADLDKLMEPGFSLLVWYDPENPSESELHRGRSGYAVLWQRILAGVSIALVYYIIRTYVKRKSAEHH